MMTGGTAGALDGGAAGTSASGAGMQFYGDTRRSRAEAPQAVVEVPHTILCIQWPVGQRPPPTLVCSLGGVLGVRDGVRHSRKGAGANAGVVRVPSCAGHPLNLMSRAAVTCACSRSPPSAPAPAPPSQAPASLTRRTASSWMNRRLLISMCAVSSSLPLTTFTFGSSCSCRRFPSHVVKFGGTPSASTGSSLSAASILLSSR
uniref:Uncharacterized protein n=1 Tax=Arundo donax TaxID=35708 RepID=A0A0A9TQS2_ARUDO